MLAVKGDRADSVNGNIFATIMIQMKGFYLTPLVLLFVIGLSAQTFSVVTQKIEGLAENERAAFLDDYLSQQRSFPLTQPYIGHFVYIGDQQSLAVAGDFNGWDPTQCIMKRIAGTDVWYQSVRFENASRVEYKFVANGEDWFTDPMNPILAPGEFRNSELRMPHYIPPREVESKSSVDAGHLVQDTITSKKLKSDRPLSIYLPHRYNPGLRYPLIIVNDGFAYLEHGNMVNVLDNMIYSSQMIPSIVVFVPPVDRTPEYLEKDKGKYTDFIVEELMPWLDEKYALINEPNVNVIMGSSLGGNISLWIAMKHPEVFGKVAALSSYIEEDILDTFEDGKAPRLDIYMLHGTYDHLPQIGESVKAFVPILEKQEFNYRYDQFPEGHSYGFWRAHIDDALKFLLPAVGKN